MKLTLLAVNTRVQKQRKFFMGRDGKALRLCLNPNAHWKVYLSAQRRRRSRGGAAEPVNQPAAGPPPAAEAAAGQAVGPGRKRRAEADVDDQVRLVQLMERAQITVPAG